MGLKATEDRLYIAAVLLHVFTGDEDVVKVDKAVGNASQHLIHQPLKGLPSILQAKGHAVVLKQAKWRYNGGLAAVSLGDRDLMISLSEIQLCEDDLPLEMGRQVLNVTRRITVPLCRQV